MVSGEGVQANRVTVAIRDHSFLSKKTGGQTPDS